MKIDKKIKICLCITQGEMGGAAQYVADIASSLDPAAYDITIAHGEKQDDWLGTWAKKHDILFHHLKTVKRRISPLYDILGLISLYRFYKKEQFDIVHLNSNKIGILGAWAAKKAGIKKIIFTVHGWAFDDPRPAWERRLYILLNKFFIRYVDTVIAVSEYVKQSAFAVGIDTEKFIIIHNGIDLLPRELHMTREHAKKFLHTNYNVNVTQFLIGTIANFYPTKGIMYLIEAINEIVLDHPEFHFCLIGKGEQETALKTYIRDHNLGRNVTIISNLTQARRVLPAFDVFALSSAKECYPYVILEAMLAGLPIVATHVGGVPEALKHYPQTHYTLIPAKDPQSLAKHIQKKVTTLPLAKETIAEFLPQISKEKMIAETEAIYKK